MIYHSNSYFIYFKLQSSSQQFNMCYYSKINILLYAKAISVIYYCYFTSNINKSNIGIASNGNFCN